MMKPSEVLVMRDHLSGSLYAAFGDTVNLHSDSDKVAEWLMTSGWVTEVPSEDAD